MFRIYILEGCPYCKKAMTTLDNLKLSYEKVIVDSKDKEKIKIKHKMGTFPQIFYEVNDKTYKIGGCDDLEDLLEIVDRIGEKHNLKVIKSIVEILEK